MITNEQMWDDDKESIQSMYKAYKSDLASLISAALTNDEVEVVRSGLRLLADERKLVVFRINADGEALMCGGCCFRFSTLFVLANTQEEANQMHQNGDAGLCGHCFSELLTNIEYSILSPFPK